MAWRNTESAFIGVVRWLRDRPSFSCMISAEQPARALADSAARCGTRLFTPPRTRRRVGVNADDEVERPNRSTIGSSIAERGLNAQRARRIFIKKVL